MTVYKRHSTGLQPAAVTRVALHPAQEATCRQGRRTTVLARKTALEQRITKCHLSLAGGKVNGVGNVTGALKNCAE